MHHLALLCHQRPFLLPAAAGDLYSSRDSRISPNSGGGGHVGSWKSTVYAATTSVSIISLPLPLCPRCAMGTYGDGNLQRWAHLDRDFVCPGLATPDSESSVSELSTPGPTTPDWSLSSLAPLYLLLHNDSDSLSGNRLELSATHYADASNGASVAAGHDTLSPEYKNNNSSSLSARLRGLPPSIPIGNFRESMVSPIYPTSDHSWTSRANIFVSDSNFLPAPLSTSQRCLK
ncbi:hypothetical protein FB45DRAFT_26777 [Roridomyces roridus]|uniref:Uncharacterized protein n=1 Tax=Roridomyces roridus TaxID=1738132 RepID=A0AAD7CK43_9AGAR|nr:hypothetical protein FB45DRAFT_26777 [Roridomyces roridus]